MTDGNVNEVVVTDEVVVAKTRGRKKSDNSLRAHIIRSVEGHTEGVSTEGILAAVTAQGYKSPKGENAKNLGVSLSILANRGDIVRLSRGLYAPAGTPIPAPVEVVVESAPVVETPVAV
jgi:hypothetical protein